MKNIQTRSMSLHVVESDDDGNGARSTLRIVPADAGDITGGRSGIWLKIDLPVRNKESLARVSFLGDAFEHSLCFEFNFLFCL